MLPELFLKQCVDFQPVIVTFVRLHSPKPTETVWCSIYCIVLGLLYSLVWSSNCKLEPVFVKVSMLVTRSRSRIWPHHHNIKNNRTMQLLIFASLLPYFYCFNKFPEVLLYYEIFCDHNSIWHVSINHGRRGKMLGLSPYYPLML